MAVPSMFSASLQGRARFAGAAALSILILWKPMLVVLFRDHVYATDLSTVFLHDACIGTSTQTVFAFCLLEVLVATVLLKDFVVPAFFDAQGWTGYDEVKRRKLVGLVIKIVVRSSCAVQIVVLVSPHFSMQSGLFPSANVKKAFGDLARNRTITDCEEAGMSLLDAAALRAWTFSRDNLMAVMVWELAYIPELQLDVWLHHVLVILGVTLGSDPQLLGGIAALQPFVDGVAFLLVLGATMMAAQELCVLMYHVRVADARSQANWMRASAASQGLIVLIFFVVLPIDLVVRHRREFGFLFLGALLLLAFLTLLELKMIWVKRSIVGHAMKKSGQALAGTDREPLTDAGGQAAGA